MNTVYNHLSVKEIEKIVGQLVYSKNWAATLKYSQLATNHNGYPVLTDIIQEAHVKLLNTAYNPERSKPSTFINTVINNHLTDLSRVKKHNLRVTSTTIVDDSGEECQMEIVSSFIDPLTALELKRAEEGSKTRTPKKGARK